jgi:mannosyltransferase
MSGPPSSSKQVRVEALNQASSVADPLNALTRPASSTWIDIHFLCLLLVLVVAAGLRFYDLDRTSLWYDEAASWQQASLPFFAMIAATAHDHYPPLHNIILHVTIAIFGDSETALRAPSALLGLASVYAIYRLGAVLWDRTTGLFAALLLTLSGFHVWYSTEARMYALLAFTATLFVLTVVNAIRRPNWAALAGCAAAGTALLYTHVYAGFVFVGVNLFVLVGMLSRARWIEVGWKRWIAMQAIAPTLFLPWALILWRQLLSQMQAGDWDPEPTGEFILHEFESLAGGPLAFLVLAILAVLSVINIAAFQASSGAIADQRKRRKAQTWLRLEWRTGILLAWLIAPLWLIAPFVGRFLITTFHARYLIGSLPAFLLLASAGLRSLATNGRSWKSHLDMGIGLTIAVVTSFPALKYSTFVRSRDDHRASMREFSARYIPSDRVIYVWADLPSRYYYRSPLADSKAFGDIARITQKDLDVDRFWLIILWTTIDKVDQLISTATRTHNVVYAFASPDNLRSDDNLEMYLFERRQKN